MMAIVVQLLPEPMAGDTGELDASLMLSTHNTCMSSC